MKEQQLDMGVGRGFLSQVFLIFMALVALAVFNPCKANAQTPPTTTVTPTDGGAAVPTPTPAPPTSADPAPAAESDKDADADDEDAEPDTDADVDVSDDDIDPDEAAVHSTRSDVAKALTKAKILAQNRVLAQARHYIANVAARNKELSELLEAEDGVKRDPAHAVAQNWGIRRLFWALAAIEKYKIENAPAAARPLTDDEVTGEEDDSLTKAMKRLDAKVEFASNDDRKVLFIAKSVERLTGKKVSLAGLGGEKPKGTKVARVTKPTKPSVAAAPQSEAGDRPANWAQECIARCGADTKCQLECR